MRWGGSVKGKTVEALLNAIPIVSPPIGMQGLLPEEPVACKADVAEDFARAAVAAQNASEEAKAHVLAGLAFIEEAYSIGALRRVIAPSVEELARG
jgi:hypothetical protein